MNPRFASTSFARAEASNSTGSVMRLKTKMMPHATRGPQRDEQGAEEKEQSGGMHGFFSVNLRPRFSRRAIAANSARECFGTVRVVIPHGSFCNPTQTHT